jgi:hypothetical protein
MTLNFDKINETLLSNYLATLREWFPNGQKLGAEWCVGSLAGEAGKSLKIHVRKGLWKDFSSGEGGSDPISLYAAILGISQGEAARRLHGTRVSAQPALTEDPEFVPVTDPPDDMPDPQVGDFSARYNYLSESGNLLGIVTRQDQADGSKTIHPRTPWYNAEGQIVWRWKGFQTPRPLYGLNQLAQRPDAVVVVVEGEKCADALRLLDSATPVVTWCGGSNAVRSANWQPLAGRRVVLWPDADEPGRKAMADVAEALGKLKAEVKLVDVPTDSPQGWDCADAIAEGWTREACFQLLAAARRISAEPLVLARVTTTTTATRTTEADMVQRVEVRDEFLPPSAPEMAQYGLQMGAGGKYIPALDSLCRIMELHSYWRGHIWWDSFLERLLTDVHGPVEPWTDHHSSRATRWVQAVFEMPTTSTDRIHEAAMTVARENPRNCLTDWLNGLQWDGVARLADLLPTGFGTARNEYHVRVGECWALSLVARAMQPGCKVDTMPVFEGSQGAGKSSALAILGGDWFGECHEDFGSKDFVLSLKGKWLIEVAEMHSFKRQDVDRLKGIMSTRVDRVRVPYGRMTEDHPRQSVFAGTTNRDDWQQDDTGARRFWAVRCGFLGLDWLRDNREQLFAEAVARFKAGQDWWSIPLADAARAADERRPEDPWEEILDKHLIDGQVYSSRELLGHPLDIDVENQSQQSATRVGRIMRRLGWERFERRTGEGTQKLWRKA